MVYRYDLMNDLMSAGTHRLWKDELVSTIGIQAAAKAGSTYIPRHIDVAGGTGDVAFRVVDALWDSFGAHRFDIETSSKAAQGERQVVVCDINAEMLRVGADRAPKILGQDKSNLV